MSDGLERRVDRLEEKIGPVPDPAVSREIIDDFRQRNGLPTRPPDEPDSMREAAEELRLLLLPNVARQDELREEAAELDAAMNHDPGPRTPFNVKDILHDHE